MTAANQVQEKILEEVEMEKSAEQGGCGGMAMLLLESWCDGLDPGGRERGEAFETRTEGVSMSYGSKQHACLRSLSLVAVTAYGEGRRMKKR